MQYIIFHPIYIEAMFTYVLTNDPYGRGELTLNILLMCVSSHTLHVEITVLLRPDFVQWPCGLKRCY